MHGADYHFVEDGGTSHAIVERATGLGALFEGVKTLLRIASRAVYVFPALALVKLVWRGEGSDLITLVFVFVVVAFFSLLALFLALFPIVGPRSSRSRQRRFAPPATLDDAAARLGLDAPVSGLPVALGGTLEGAPPLRLRGTLRRLDPRGAAPGRDLLCDTWGSDLKRVVEGVHFTLAVGDVPIVIELGTSPLCVGAYTARADGTRSLTFRDGDRVELIATGYRTVDDIEQIDVGGQHWSPSVGGDAYRHGRTAGLHVVCRAATPVVIATC